MPRFPFLRCKGRDYLLFLKLFPLFFAARIDFRTTFVLQKQEILKDEYDILPRMWASSLFARPTMSWLRSSNCR